MSVEPFLSLRMFLRGGQAMTIETGALTAMRTRIQRPRPLERPVQRPHLAEVVCALFSFVIECPGTAALAVVLGEIKRA